MKKLFPLLCSLIFFDCLCVPSQASCDHRKTGSQACQDLLTNRNSQFASTLMALCAGGEFSTTKLCDRSGSIGGCLCEGCENGRAVTWFYPDADAGVTTTADVMRECTSHSQEFQSP